LRRIETPPNTVEGYFVGNQTSFRRDCDPPNPRRGQMAFAVGNQTSFRRDCDVLFGASLPFPLVLVGNQTSFRRDCDLPLDIALFSYSCRKPDLI